MLQNSPFLREALSGVCSVPFFQANLCTHLRLFYLWLDATQHARRETFKWANRRMVCQNGYIVLGRDTFLYLSARNELVFSVCFADRYKNMSLPSRFRCILTHHREITNGGCRQILCMIFVYKIMFGKMLEDWCFHEQ